MDREGLAYSLCYKSAHRHELLPDQNSISSVLIHEVNCSLFRDLLSVPINYPQGVGWTTPRLDIFSTRQESLQIEGHISDSMNSTADSLGRVLGVAQIASSLAQLRAQRVAAHMSTPEVARDMLNIVKAHNFDKIQYWGVS